MVYLNTTALQDYAPTASWYGIVDLLPSVSVNDVVLTVHRAAFLNSFASGVEGQAKQLTPDLKGKLIDLVQAQAESQKMSIVYRPSDFAIGAAAAQQKIDAENAAAAVAKVETLTRKQKVVKVKEVQLSGNLADRGNLHTDMIKLKSAADAQQQEVTGGGDHRNYYFKSQGLSVARVDEIEWTSDSHSAGATGWTSDEERIAQKFGQGKYGQRELIIFNSLRGFYNVPPTFLHAILHAALRFPTPLVAKAREYIDALSEDGTAPYAAVHLRRGADYEKYCRAVKDHEGDVADERVKITDRALVFDRCYTPMTDIIHRLTAIREMGNYTRIFVATDLTAQDGDDVLLSDLPWVHDHRRAPSSFFVLRSSFFVFVLLMSYMCTTPSRCPS
jgi:hypothetical protein